MTAEDSYATRLAKKITASERTYLRLADDCRKAYDAIGDVRWRAMAEGLALARDHMLSVAEEMRALPSLRDRASDPAVVAAVAAGLGPLVDKGAATRQAEHAIAVVLGALEVPRG